MTKGVTFTAAGKSYYVTATMVTQALAKQEPRGLRKHVVEVDGIVFPVKQALAAASGADLADLGTYPARQVLRKLGFEVRRVDE